MKFEGDWGSWSKTVFDLYSYGFRSPFGPQPISVYNAGKGSDDTTFLFIGEDDNYLYKYSNVSGSWAVTFVADTAPLNRGSPVFGFVQDSNGYWHISFWHRPVAGNVKIAYGTNDNGGNWIFYNAMNPELTNLAQEQLSQYGITYLEANQEVYIVYRIASGQAVSGGWINTIDKS